MSPPSPPIFGTRAETTTGSTSSARRGPLYPDTLSRYARYPPYSRYSPYPTQTDRISMDALIGTKRKRSNHRGYDGLTPGNFSGAIWLAQSELWKGIIEEQADFASEEITTSYVHEQLDRALADYLAFKASKTNGSSKQKCLEWLNIEMVEKLMDRIQLLLDSVHAENVQVNRQDHKNLSSLLQYLSKEFQVLPPSLFIHDVRKDGTNPVDGGGFADVWRGTLKEKPVCLKVLRLFLEQDDETYVKLHNRFCREALVWQRLKHPNILPLLGVNSDLCHPSFCLISPWMENQNVIRYLKKNPDHDILSILSDVSAGLNYLHSQDPPVVHGDIRGANILVADDFRCCLADFGLTVIITESHAWTGATSSSSRNGSIRWLAPEYMDHSTSPKVAQTSRDIYAFGCTIFEIFTKEVPFHYCVNDYAVINCVSNGQRPSRPENIAVPDIVWSLVDRCWQQNLQIRPEAHDVYDILRPLSQSSDNVATAVRTAHWEDLFAESSDSPHTLSDEAQVPHPVGCGEPVLESPSTFSALPAVGYPIDSQYLHTVLNSYLGHSPQDV